MRESRIKRYAALLAPELENYIQDNFPEVEEDRIPDVARGLIEYILVAEEALVAKEASEADKVKQDTRAANMKKAARKTYVEEAWHKNPEQIHRPYERYSKTEWNQKKKKEVYEPGSSRPATSRA